MRSPGDGSDIGWTPFNPLRTSLNPRYDDERVCPDGATMIKVAVLLLSGG